jgi:hypothetical protein
MSSPAQSTRRLVSFSLIGLGCVVPALLVLYYAIRYGVPPQSYGLSFSRRVHEWMPLTTLCWTAAVFVWPDSRPRWIAWVIVVIGGVLSFASLILWSVQT